MNKYWSYFKYVERHKRYVLIECFKLGVPWRGLVHDLSKFSYTEYKAYADYFYDETYQSTKKIQSENPNSIWTAFNKSIEDAFDFAWLHHQHYNKHHWQYWLLREDDGDTKALDMPEVYIKEMVADWRGAGRAIKGKDEVDEWYNNNKERIIISDKTRAKVEELIFGKGDK